MKIKKTIIITLILLSLIFTLLFNLYNKPEENSIIISGAYKSLSLLGFQRSYPNKTVPDSKYFREYKLSKVNLKKYSSLLDTVEPWRTMGPHNMGGRTLTIEFNPQNPHTIYAGSASGGLWKSYTAGVGADAWEYVPTGFPVLAVSSIAIAPDDSNKIFIGTGEVYNYYGAGTGAAFRPTRGTYGIGILKTTDGGITWDQSLDWSYNQQHGIWMIKFNPLNYNSIWAATTDGTYKSVDAGETWSKIHDVVMATDIVISPIDTNIVIVACGNVFSTGAGIYRTTDGGQVWNKISAGLPEPRGGKTLLDISKSTPNVVYASIGEAFVNNSQTWLFLSFDSGESWGEVSNENYSQWQGWFSHDVAVDPTNTANVFAIGIDIWKSDSWGGNLVQKSNWQDFYRGNIPPGEAEGTPFYSHADHHSVIYHPENSNIVYFATDGGVFRTTDGGNTFEGCNGGYQTVQFYNGFSCSQQDSNLAMGGLQDNGTIIYNGSTTWNKFAVGGDGSWTGINSSNDKTMYASSQLLYIAKSTNKGRTWAYLNIPWRDNTCFIAPFVLGVDNPEIIYAGRDIVYKSSSGGRNWTETYNGRLLDGNPVFVLAISQQNSNIVYAATAPTIGGNIPPNVFRTKNGGNSWENITGTLPDRFPGDITVDPNDDSNVYITYLGFGTSHVFKSNTYGDTWQDIGASLPDVPTSSIVSDPKFPKNIYIGNDIGVYVSTDGGDSWYEFNDGLPDAVIAMDLAISPISRELRVATHGNGAFERKLVKHTTGTNDVDTEIPNQFVLEQNYPNPFNSTTTISYYLSNSAYVTLKVYNELGQEVKTLMSDRLNKQGDNSATWDGTDNDGNSVVTGTYIYRLQAGDFVQTKKMTYLK